MITNRTTDNEMYDTIDKFVAIYSKHATGMGERTPRAVRLAMDDIVTCRLRLKAQQTRDQ